MILGSFLTVGCRKDNDSKVFTAVIPNYNGAKDYIDGSMVFWSNGDAVRINDGVFTVAIDDGDRNRATINTQGINAINEEYFAAYPADIASITNADHITFALPHEETYTTDGGRQVIHSVMAAKADGHTLHFQNVCALLHFKVCTNVSGAKLRAAEVITDKPMWGTIATEYSSSQWQVTSVTGTDNTSRTLRFDTPLTLSAEAKDVYLIIPPVSNATTFTLRLTVDDGTTKVFEKSKEGTFSFSSGNLYHFDDINTFTSSGMKFGTSDPVATVTNGSEEHPYLIYSSENWTALASSMGTQNKHITLASDINVGSTLDRDFKAILDGNGHTITLTTQNISLFGTINGGTVKNLTIAATNDVTNPNLITNGDTRYFGVLAGRVLSGSTIINCSNNVDIICDNTRSKVYIGGLCGLITGSTIINCLNNGDISSNALYVGGVFGYVTNPTEFTRCINNGNISIRTNSGVIYTSDVGGVVGYLTGSSSVTLCHNYGSINIINPSTSTVSNYGGIVGTTASNIEYCSNIGDINCSTNGLTMYFGGIVGNYSLTSSLHYISNCYNEGDIITTQGSSGITIGGIIGKNARMNIFNSYVFCDLTGTTIAGISADGKAINNSNINISNCYYYGTMTSNSSINGIAGESTNTYKFLIDHCYYPVQYSLCHSTSTDNDDNATLSSATTLSITGGNLYEALNDNIGAMPAGSYSWKNSTESPVHAVFNIP